jgi:hypothetical protein
VPVISLLPYLSYSGLRCVSLERKARTGSLLDQANANSGVMNLPAFRLFIDLLAGEGGHGGIEALGAVAGNRNRPIVVPWRVCGTTVFGTFQEVAAREGLFGERGGTRTLDPMIKSHVLYHLSYALTCRAV